MLLRKRSQKLLQTRSEYRKVFNNGDGTYTAYTNTAPIHFLDNGEWTEIDNTLVDNGDGFYKNKNNSFSVSLPSELNIADAESSAVNLSYEKLNISCALTNIEIPSGFESQPAYIDVNNAVYDSAYDMNIPEGLAAAFSNASAEADYRSISDGLDLNMSVHNSTFTESLVINDVDKIPESVTYSVSAEDVQLERAEDNSLLFLRDGEVVLEIPMFVMSDSAEELNEYIINYDVFETENGYDIVLYPLSSVGDVGSVAAPAYIGTIFRYERDHNTCYNSKYSPDTVYSDRNYFIIGESNRSGNQTYITIDDNFTMYGQQAVILEAEYSMYVYSHTNNSKIQVFSNNTSVPHPSWNNDYLIDEYNTLIKQTDSNGNETNTIDVNANDWIDIDLTNLTQAWLNNVNSANNNIGLFNNGFKIVIGNSNPNHFVYARSERASANTPYFKVRFSINIASHTLEYAPYKYNDINNNIFGTINNFQTRMNCYAYALQMYYKGNGSYSLQPGEIGFAYNSDSSVYNRSRLSYEYSSGNFSSTNAFLQYLCSHMENDFRQMNITYSKLNSSNFIYDDDGNIGISPLSEAESGSKRIIAVTCSIYHTEYPPSSTLGSNTIVHKAGSYHYLLRNGNKTCPNAGRNGHDTYCSMWSHKPNMNEVTNQINNVVLCDKNIVSKTQSYGYEFLGDRFNFSIAPAFYVISQDTNVYDSWFEANSNVGLGTNYSN